MKYTCYVKEDQLSQQYYQAITQFLNASGWQQDDNNPQLVITIGGDGTVLTAIHKYINGLNGIAFVGVHTGSLGFFNDYKIEEVKTFIQDLLTKQPQYESRRLLQAVIDRDENNPIYALNEIRIENNIKTQVIQVNIDNQVLEVLRGTGICISTQAGSTGFNRSVNGAVIDDRLEVLQVSEIAAIHNSRYHSLGSPLVLSKDRKITIVGQNFNFSVLCYDHLYTQLKCKKQVECRLSDKVVYFARFKPNNYIERIRTLF